MTFDLRTQLEVMHLTSDSAINSLNYDYNVWKHDARIIHTQISSKQLSPKVHYLRGQGIVLRVNCDVERPTTHMSLTFL